MIRSVIASILRVSERSWFKQLATLLVLAAAYSVLISFWVIGSHSWFHSELLNISKMAWLPDRADSLAAQFRLLFDWAYFDSSPYRLRPLSDLFEIIDAVLRPATVWLFGLHPSLTLSALTLAITAPLFLFLTVKMVGFSRFQAALFLLLLMTTVGYLSSFIPYIRPAKKLAFFLTCLTIWLIFRYQKSKSQRDFFILLSMVFISFFADETGYALWVITLIFLGPQLVCRRDYKGLSVFASMPVVYLLVAKGLMPVIYGTLGNYGARSDVIAGSVVERLLGYVLEPQFYIIAFNDMSTGTLTSLGILDANNRVIIFFTILFWTLLALSTFLLYRKREQQNAIVYWNVIASSLVLIAMSFSLTLFDWFNNPFASNYLGALTYYYHNVTAILAVLWLACIVRMVVTLPCVILGKQLIVVGSVVMIVMIAAANISNFQTLNRLFQILHTYPLDITSLTGEALQIDQKKRTIQVIVPATSDVLVAEYSDLVANSLGPRRTIVIQALEHFKSFPMGNASYVEDFVQMFFPGYQIHAIVQNMPEGSEP